MNIFLQPAGQIAEEQLKITINKKENLERLKEYITDEQYDELKKIYPNKQLNMWGVTLNKKDVWEQMQNGDLVLFYGLGKFFVKGIIQYKLHNRELAKNIWGVDKDELSWEYIFFLDDAKQINIPLEEFNKITGYKFKHVQGAMRIRKKEVVYKLVETYKDIFEFNYEEIQKKEEETRIQKLENQIWQLDLKNINKKCKIVKYNPKVKDNTTTDIIDNKDTNKNKEKKSKELTESISSAAKSHLGISGELYIYNMLKEKDEQLLKNLNLLNEEMEIECYNKEYNGQKDWEDKSINKGHDILVKIKEREIYLEVKTSIQDTNLYSMTGNELKLAKIKKDNYYVIKINNFKYINSLDEKKPKVLVIENPYKIVEQGDAIKDISIYC